METVAMVILSRVCTHMCNGHSLPCGASCKPVCAHKNSHCDTCRSPTCGVVTNCLECGAARARLGRSPQAALPDDTALRRPMPHAPRAGPDGEGDGYDSNDSRDALRHEQRFVQHMPGMLLNPVEQVHAAGTLAARAREDTLRINRLNQEKSEAARSVVTAQCREGMSGTAGPPPASADDERRQRQSWLERQQKLANPVKATLSQKLAAQDCKLKDGELVRTTVREEKEDVSRSYRVGAFSVVAPKPSKVEARVESQRNDAEARKALLRARRGQLVFGGGRVGSSTDGGGAGGGGAGPPS